MFSICLKAQYNNYDLNKYTNPDFKRKSLDIFFNSAGNFERDNQINNNFVKGNAAFQFNAIKSNRRIQDQTTLGITGIISHSKLNNESYTKTRQDSITIIFDRKAHYYITPKQFIEVSPRANMLYEYDRTKTSQSIETRSRKKKFRTEFELDLGYGIGRLENVTDARQAIYILEDLQSKGVLRKTLTSEQINELARQMAIIKNKRQFDAREKTIEELTFVNNYLIAQNYIDSINTAEYFLSLNDFWGNGDKVMRVVGHRFKLGLAPTYIFQGRTHKNTHINAVDNNEVHQYTQDIDNKWGGTFYIDYTHEKAINMKFQQSFNIGSRNGLYRWKNRKSNEFLQHSYAKLTYGYYANTRTYFELALSEHFYWNHTPKSSLVEHANTLSSDTKIDFKGYYFISGQLRIFGSFGMEYSYFREAEINQTRYNKYPHSRFDFGIQLSIF